ncbi:MAG TPA: HisA/HisF-related TIM barrel protein [Candidatus Nanoarchaeia archaeon]|nr:HisA/HisF-related TIM barrel protein [Candidatus Nanoarchaeia archaeon]
MQKVRDRDESMIYPCIDLLGGKVVQLVQGKAENKKVEIEDYDELIKKFKPFGSIQLIDLDAAMGKGNNYLLIKEILKKIECRVGGGIRTVAKAKEVLGLGAIKVIIGSSVFYKENGDYKINNDFLNNLIQKIPKEKIIIAIDSIKQEIVIKGWKENTGLNIFKTAKYLESYCSEFLATYVDKEGMLQGTDLDFFKKLANTTKNQITAAGGISTIKEIKELEKININSALGMAIYTNKIDLNDILP